VSLSSLFRTWFTLALIVALMGGLIAVVHYFHHVALPDVVRMWLSLFIAAAETVLIVSAVKSPEWARR